MLMGSVPLEAVEEEEEVVVTRLAMLSRILREAKYLQQGKPHRIETGATQRRCRVTSYRRYT